MRKLLLIMLVFASCTSKEIDKQSKAESLVKKFLDSTLKDPKSYESIEFSKVKRLNDTSYISKYTGKLDSAKYNGALTITHRYRAKNSFGGYVINSGIFHIDSLMTKANCCFSR